MAVIAGDIEGGNLLFADDPGTDGEKLPLAVRTPVVRQLTLEKRAVAVSEMNKALRQSANAYGKGEETPGEPLFDYTMP